MRVRERDFERDLWDLELPFFVDLDLELDLDRERLLRSRLPRFLSLLLERLLLLEECRLLLNIQKITVIVKKQMKDFFLGRLPFPLPPSSCG